MELNEEMLEAIKKTLPGHLSDVLRSQLIDLKNLKVSFEESIRKIQILNSEVSLLRPYKEEHDATKQMRESLFKERQEFEISKREERIAMLKEKYTDTVRLMDSVFRNQRLVWNTNGSRQVPMMQNGYMTSQQESETSVTSKGEE